MRNYFTPINKLHLSVILGWATLLIAVLSALVMQDEINQFNENIIMCGFWAYVILAIRYSVLKLVELMGAVFAGWLTTSIFEYFSGIRNNDAGPNIIYWTFVLAIFLFVFIKSAIISTYFLLRETYQLVKYYRNKKQFMQNIRVQC